MAAVKPVPLSVIQEAAEVKGYGASVYIIRKYDPSFRLAAPDGTPLQVFSVEVEWSYHETLIVHAPDAKAATKLVEDERYEPDWNRADVEILTPTKCQTSDRPDLKWTPS